MHIATNISIATHADYTQTPMYIYIYMHTYQVVPGPCRGGSFEKGTLYIYICFYYCYLFIYVCIYLFISSLLLTYNNYIYICLHAYMYIDRIIYTCIYIDTLHKCICKNWPSAHLPCQVPSPPRPRFPRPPPTPPRAVPATATAPRRWATSRGGASRRPGMANLSESKGGDGKWVGGIYVQVGNLTGVIRCYKWNLCYGLLWLLILLGWMILSKIIFG